MRAASVSTVSPGRNPLAAGLVPTSLTGLFILPQIVTGYRHAPRNAVSHNGIAQLITQRSINRQVTCAKHGRALNRQVPVVAGANPARCTLFPLKTRQLVVAGIYPPAGALLASGLGFFSYQWKQGGERWA